MNKLLFINQKNIHARWIVNDLEILRGSYEVSHYEAGSTKGLKLIIDLLKQFLFHVKSIGRYDIYYIWFADYHSLIPVLFSRFFFIKSVLVIGGYDADEILINKPRNFKEWIRRLFVLCSVKFAHFLLPVSEVNKVHLSRYVSGNKCEVIYNCINTEQFGSETESIRKKKNLIITVGGGGDFVKEAKRKRLDYFITLGEKFNRLYPEYGARFYLIGHDKGTLTHEYLENLINDKCVEVKQKTTSDDELISYFKDASIYMQLSFYEAFGVAQAEAMLFGCIPVSNPGGAITEVVGDAGFLISGFNTEEYISAIKSILDGKHENLRIKARNRVINAFSLNIRKDKLLKIIDSLLS